MKKYLLPLALLTAVASSVSAQIAVNFAFGPGVDDYTASAIDGAFVSNASDFAAGGAGALTSGNNAGTLIGPGTDAAGTSYALGTRDDRYGQANGFAATFDATNTNGLYGASAADYVGFSFTAASAFDPSALEFDFAQGGSSGARGFTATYNLNGGSFTTLGVAAMDVGSSGQFGRYSFDFGSLSLAASDVVEVRFLGFSTGTGNSVRFDNVSVTAVPEPSTYALIGGLLTLGFVVIRRRKA